jgi:hypothetical protein
MGGGGWIVSALAAGWVIAMLEGAIRVGIQSRLG